MVVNYNLTQVEQLTSFDLETSAFHWSLLIFGSISIAINSLFTAMFIIFRKKFLVQNNNKIILSMTLADNLVGLFSIMLAASLMTRQPQVVYKLLGVIPLFGSMFSSIFSLSIMTLDRLIAIRIPLKHKAIMSPSRVKGLIIVCWILPIFFIAQEMLIYVQFSWQTELIVRGYTLFTFFSVGTMFLTIANVHLYKTIRKHARVVSEKILAQGKKFRISGTFSGNTPESNTCSMHLYACRRELKMAKAAMREIQAARLCIKIVLIFIVCWLPLTSYRLRYSLHGSVGIAWLRRFCLQMAVMNSLINPAVYLLTRLSFQKYMWRFLTCKYRLLRRPSHY